MTLNTYLTFNGNCREAFDFYRAVFGSEFQVLQTFGDGPDDMNVSEALKSQVMHVSLPVGNSVLMGSDTGNEEQTAVIGDNFSISYEAESRAETDEVFGKLADGGTVTMPLQETFWGSYFGSCTDRFGINWMVSCEASGT